MEHKKKDGKLLLMEGKPVSCSLKCQIMCCTTNKKKNVKRQKKNVLPPHL